MRSKKPFVLTEKIKRLYEPGAHALSLIQFVLGGGWKVCLPNHVLGNQRIDQIFNHTNEFSIRIIENVFWTASNELLHLEV